MNMFFKENNKYIVNVSIKIDLDEIILCLKEGNSNFFEGPAESDKDYESEQIAEYNIDIIPTNNIDTFFYRELCGFYNTLNFIDFCEDKKNGVNSIEVDTHSGLLRLRVDVLENVVLFLVPLNDIVTLQEKGKHDYSVFDPIKSVDVYTDEKGGIYKVWRDGRLSSKSIWLGNKYISITAAVNEKPIYGRTSKG